MPDVHREKSTLGEKRAYTMNSISRLSRKAGAASSHELIRVIVRLSKTAQFAADFPKSASLKRLKRWATTQFSPNEGEAEAYELRYKGESFPEGMKLEQFKKSELDFELKLRSSRDRFGESLFLR